MVVRSIYPNDIQVSFVALLQMCLGTGQQRNSTEKRCSSSPFSGKCWNATIVASQRHGQWMWNLECSLLTRFWIFDCQKWTDQGLGIQAVPQKSKPLHSESLPFGISACASERERGFRAPQLPCTTPNRHEVCQYVGSHFIVEGHTLALRGDPQNLPQTMHSVTLLHSTTAKRVSDSQEGKVSQRCWPQPWPSPTSALLKIINMILLL